MNKGIIITFFGTSNKSSLNEELFLIKKEVEERYKNFRVNICFSSTYMREIIYEKYNIKILSVEEGISEMKENNIEDIIILPLHLQEGKEIEELRGLTNNHISVCEPILSIKNNKLVFEEELIKIFENINKSKNIVFVGHGVENLDNTAFHILNSLKLHNMFFGSIKGKPSLNDVVNMLKSKGISEVLLCPLLVVLGYHAKKDIFGDGAFSWKNQLTQKGINVINNNSSLGMIKEFRQLYLKSIDNLLAK